MRVIRVILLVLYASYLTNVGLLMLVLPWSDGWAHLVFLMPAGVGSYLDDPVWRGVISAFGLLHLVLLLAELVKPAVSPHHHR